MKLLQILTIADAFPRRVNEKIRREKMFNHSQCNKYEAFRRLILFYR